MGFKQHDPTVYIVYWRGAGVVKVGYTEHKRWRRFELRRAILKGLLTPGGIREAFALESWGGDWLRARYPAAFRTLNDSRPFVGVDGGGYRECFAVPEDAADELVALMLERCLGASAQASTFHARADARYERYVRN